MSIDERLGAFIRWSFFALVFFVPLVLFPKTYELFEFNKMMLVYGITAVIAALWIARMIVSRRLIFRRTPFDLFLVLFLLSQIASTVWSIDPHTSLWGYYSRFHGGLLSSICYALLFWAYVSNFDFPKVPSSKFQVPSMIYFILASAALVAGYGILEHFGIDQHIWVQDVKNRVFSTLGQPNWLAAYLDAIIFVPLALALALKKMDLKFFIYYLLFFIFYLTLVFTKSKSGLLAFWVVLPLFHLGYWLVYRNRKIILAGLANLALLLFLTGMAYPQLGVKLKTVFRRTDHYRLEKTDSGSDKFRTGGSPTSEIRRVVWKGALSVWQHFPLFGSGNETFAYSYYNFRPREHNDNSEWDFLYNKAHNEYLNYLACTGLAGLAAVLGWQLAWPLWLLWPKKNSVRIAGAVAVIAGLLAFNPGHLLDPLVNRILIYPPIGGPLAVGLSTALAVIGVKRYFFSRQQTPRLPLAGWQIALAAGLVSMMLTNFYGFSVVAIGLFTFLFPAVSWTAAVPTQTPASKETAYFNNLQVAGLAGIAVILTFTLFGLVHRWQGDIRFNEGKNLSEAGRYTEALTPLTRAVSANPGEPLYLSQIGETAAALAYLYYQDGATDSAELSQSLAELALANGKQALVVSPYHINYYKSLAKIYLSLSGIKAEYKQDAIQTLEAAAVLSPTDPKLLVNIGLLYEPGAPEKAIARYQKAIELKPDYDHAYVYLARLYRKQKQEGLTRQTYQALLDNFYPPNKEALEYLSNNPKK